MERKIIFQRQITNYDRPNLLLNPKKIYYEEIFEYIQKEKQMENIPEDFEDKIEHAYWCFNDKLSKKNFSDRDCFKQTLRRYFNLNKGKPMENKVIFESEEHYDKFFDECYSRDYLTMKENVKQKGYIRKLAVEEAEEMYKKWMKVNENEERYNREQLEIMLKQHDAIQELKAENERLKK